MCSCGLDGWQMNAAFGLGFACPATGTRVFSGLYGFGARPAADAGIAVIVEWVVWQVVGVDVFPDLIARPGGQRIEFDHLVGIIPFDESRVCAEGSLVAADAGDPGIVVGEKLSLGNHLAN